MKTAYRRGLSALAVLAVTAIPLSVSAPAQAEPGDFTQEQAHGSVDQQADGTFLFTGGWEYTVDVNGYAPPVVFTGNVLIARADDGTDYYGTERPVCTSVVDSTSNLATVTCDGKVAVPTAFADYAVTSLLFGRDATNQLVGTETMYFAWADPTVDPVDPVDNGCPDGESPLPVLDVCVGAVGNVPVMCVASLRHERWVPGTGTAEFKGGRKENGDKWRDEPLKVEAGHVVLVDQKFGYEPGTRGEACSEETRNGALEKFYNDIQFGLPELWHGTPESGGFSMWEGRTNGYRLGDYGYAAVNTLVECKTYDGTNIIAECDDPFTGVDEFEKVTLACDGPRYRDSDDPTGHPLFGGWTVVAPEMLTAAGCATPEVPTPEVPTPEVPTPEVPVPEVPVPEEPTPEEPTPEDPTPEDPTPEDPTPTPEDPKDPTPDVPTIDAGAAHAAAQTVTGQAVTTPVGVATSALFLGLSLGLGVFAHRCRYLGKHLA